jgi:ABC-type uncharacterized transport system substrate-binding protein
MQASGSRCREHRYFFVGKAVALAALLSLGACNAPFEIPEAPPQQPVETPTKPVEPVEIPPPAAATTPKPAPQPPVPAVPPEPATPPGPVAIVVSSPAAGYQTVAAALVQQLGEREHHVYELAGDTVDVEQIFAAIRKLNNPLTVAIGLPAAQAVSRLHNGPAVFCQVFNYAPEHLALTRMRGVAAFPPLDLQIEAWKAISPKLMNVGAIVGPGHDELMSNATFAATAAGVDLQHLVAGSDREALYVFKRMAADLDGLWLFPDNRILSASVLREMLGYALRRDVQVLVFNPSLLKLGALLSASSQADDIAATVLQLLDAMATEEPSSLPELTNLSAMEVELNPSVAGQFGVVAGGAQRRVMRR